MRNAAAVPLRHLFSIMLPALQYIEHGEMSSVKLSCNMFWGISLVDIIRGRLLFYILVCIRGVPISHLHEETG